MTEEYQIRIIKERNIDLIELLMIADPCRRLVDDYLDRGIVYGAFDGIKLLGAFVLIKTRPEIMEIVNIVVKEEFQGKGIAKGMIRYALDISKEKGARTVEIGTGNSGINQMALYQKCGFRIVGVDRDFFIRHYEEVIFENGIQCIDMIRLSQDL